MRKVHKNGSIIYYNEAGQYHREDGPAVEYIAENKYKYCIGDKIWYKDGKCHRENGPAVEFANGEKWWYKNGKYHREDGPAKEYPNGRREYWINDELLENITNDEELFIYWILQ